MTYENHSLFHISGVYAVICIKVNPDDEEFTVTPNSTELNEQVQCLNGALNYFWTRWRDEYLIELREAHRPIAAEHHFHQSLWEIWTSFMMRTYLGFFGRFFLERFVVSQFNYHLRLECFADQSSYRTCCLIAGTRSYQGHDYRHRDIQYQ